MRKTLWSLELLPRLLWSYCRLMRSDTPMSFKATGLLRKALDLQAAMTSNSGTWKVNR